MSPFRQASTSSVSSVGSTEMMEPSYSTRADDLPDKNADSLIARQALELLVSCLRLRSSHLGKSDWTASDLSMKFEPISGRVDKASATETVAWGSIPGRVKPKTIKIDIHSFSA